MADGDSTGEIRADSLYSLPKIQQALGLGSWAMRKA
jgi:hypothetical protein